ncbi:Ig-like domain-containing protein [Staphylococcus sp. KG4-3]|uniref:Ig-like domain-containing protein n=1 Tax=Staphylococcus sp. KG4-3 TaxID=3093634 RepID=UPI00298F3C1F|nr:Ig-like domain-containing protein [Staphylococcus sp. KG4-3]MDW8544423.1 Ig-like domain-containing protein [Staphylococcus sp. KG4-1]MDW8560817.1 Ig-like domain-containing protein [Staphylococcus sp. KG4-3]
MADKLKVYKDDEVIASAERGEDGKANATIEGLDANTEYETGDYKVAWENENGESDKTDVPGFKTNPIKVTGVSLDKEELTLDVGDTATIEATVAPSTASDKSVSYASSNKDVATVDEDGKITAVDEGTATIEVTTNDGEKTAECEITVEAEEEPAPEEPDNVEVEANENDADVSAE